MTDEEARKLAQDGRAELQAWWVPQIPGPAFDFAVPDYQTGRLLCDALGKYDLFQLEHRIKPDFCNGGGISWRHPDVTSGEWWELDEDEARDLGFCP